MVSLAFCYLYVLPPHSSSSIICDASYLYLYHMFCIICFEMERYVDHGLKNEAFFHSPDVMFDVLSSYIYNIVAFVAFRFDVCRLVECVFSNGLYIILLFVILCVWLLHITILGSMISMYIVLFLNYDLALNCVLFL